jgi:hypothetical protein
MSLTGFSLKASAVEYSMISMHNLTIEVIYKYLPVSGKIKLYPKFPKYKKLVMPNNKSLKCMLPLNDEYI